MIVESMQFIHHRTTVLNGFLWVLVLAFKDIYNDKLEIYDNYHIENHAIISIDISRIIALF